MRVAVMKEGGQDGRRTQQQADDRSEKLPDQQDTEKPNPRLLARIMLHGCKWRIPMTFRPID
jgi:hypothetical protein